MLMTASPPKPKKEEEDVPALKAKIKELEEALKTSAVYPVGTPSAPTLRAEKRGTAEEVNPRTTIVLFGADGNLATKKTFPTLFALWRKQLLPRSTLVVGYARDDMTLDQFRRIVYKSVYSSAHSQSERTSFLERCHYVAGQFDDAEHFRSRLKPTVEALEKQRDESLSVRSVEANLRVYYLAVPPFLYASICTALRDANVREPDHHHHHFRGGGDDDGYFFRKNNLPKTHHRYVLEKPFGRDLKSCRDLCEALGEVVREDEAYRIDHYLGKELVMNVLVLRFANVCFEAIWSRFHVSRVEVCCLEEIGTAGRGGYFDKYGIIRDVMQNHLAQILALVAMEQPLSFEAEDIRREKVKVLRSVRKLDAGRDLVVGQYDGYVDDESVIDKRSKTETFAAARLYIDNPRWAGVPFILTAGKALAQKKVEVKITFHKVAGAVPDCSNCDANELVVRVQPDECIYWRVQNRVPGLHSKLKIEPRRMNLLYTPTESRGMPEAYERLLLEVIRGDATNFVSVDELDAAWTIFNDALLDLADRPSRPERYAFGSDGPCTKRLVDPSHHQYWGVSHHHSSHQHLNHLASPPSFSSGTRLGGASNGDAILSPKPHLHRRSSAVSELSGSDYTTFFRMESDLDSIDGPEGPSGTSDIRRYHHPVALHHTGSPSVSSDSQYLSRR